MIGSIVGVLFSLFSLWPIFTLFNVGHIIFYYLLLNIIVIPVYRYYINFNIFNFESERTPTTAVIKIFLFGINLILSIILFRVDMKILISFVGAYMCHLTYLYSIFDRTSDWSEGGILQVKNLTISYICRVIEIQLVIKLFICVVLLILGKEISYTPWIISFLIDLLIYSTLKRITYNIRIFQEGFRKQHNELISSFWRIIVIGCVFIVSLLISKTPPFYPYLYIMDFLSREVVVEAVPYEVEERSEPFQDDFSSLLKEFEDDNFRPNPFWEDFWAILSRLFIVIFAVVIFRLFIYPLIQPFFKALKSSDPLWKTLKRLFRELWLSLFFKKRYIKEDVLETLSPGFTREKERYRGMVEVYNYNTLVRYYNKLLKFVQNMSESRIYKSSTVEEVFHHLDRENQDIRVLETLFHRGFYSKNGISRKELKEIKNYLKLLLKK